MAAPVLKLTDYQNPKNVSEKFVPPTVEQVAEVMKNRYGWPDEFTNDMAENFVAHYEARGWKYNGNIKMVSWQSAVTTWYKKFKYDNRFQSYMDKMDKMRIAEQKPKKELKDMDMDAAINYMDGVLIAYKAGMKPDRESAFKMYEYLKSMGVMKLPKETIDHIRVMSGNNMDAAKLHALKYFLDRMVQNNLTFKIYR